MGAIFHNYKQLLQITKEDTAIDESTKTLIDIIACNKSEGKILFYGYSKKWHGLIYSFHKERD